MASKGKTPKEKVKKLGLFKNLRKSTTDLSEWNKNDEKILKAVENGDTSKVESILNKKTIVTTKLGPKGLSIFHVACATGKTQIVEKLLGHGADVNVLTIQGCTSLQLAAANDQPAIIQRLVHANAVLEHKDGNNLTALHHACIGPSLQSVQILLQYNADISVRDKTGKTPLFYAAHYGNSQICKELLDRGADPNACDNHQISPLMAGAKKGGADVCDLLLKKGADPNAQDQQGKEAVDYAHEEGHAHLREVFERAPKQASWDVPAGGQSMSAGAEGGSNNSVSEMAEADQGDIVAQFVPDNNSPTPEKRPPPSQTPPPEPHRLLPQARPIEADQRVADAYKGGKSKQELEEEHEQLNEDYIKVRTENQKLQGELGALQRQISEKVIDDRTGDLENQVQELQTQLSVEQEKYQELEDKMATSHRPENAKDEDAWNSNDEDLFDSPDGKSKEKNLDKKQTVAFLRSQILTLRQENEQLKNQSQTSVAVALESRPADSNDITFLNRQLMEKDNDIEELHNKLITLEEENKILIHQVKHNKKENLAEGTVQTNGNVSDMSHDTDNDQSESSYENKSESDVQKENMALREECEALRLDLDTLRDTYEKLVLAGDNLQDMYDQVLLDKDMQTETLEKIAQEKEELVKDNEFLLSDGNALHDDLEKLVQELETLQETNKTIQEEKEDIERKLGAVNMSGKASEMAKLMEERDKYRDRVMALEGERDGLREDHEVVLEEVQSMQEQCQRMTVEQETMQQEFDSVQDEYDQIQQQNDALQQDYQQLEQDYSELLADKEKLEQEFLEVQKASIQIDNKDSTISEKLQQENSELSYEKEQLELTINEMSKNSALLEEKYTKQGFELAKTQEQLKKELTIRVKQESEAGTDKEKLVKSLQIQVSRLQQQLAETDRHHRDVVNTYRTHLISAVQGQMDCDVQRCIFNIIELRSREEYC